MRESRPSGSVEGVMGNHDSYSDPVPLRRGAKHDFADFRAEYQAVCARLTAVAARGDEGAVRATLAQMSEDEACAIASQILDLAYKATDASEQERESARRKH